MNKKRITLLSIGLFGTICGLILSYLPKSFSMAKADDVQVIDAGYCSTIANATKTKCKFEMLPNDAPLVKYQPTRSDCVTLKRNGKTIKLSTDYSWDMISKTNATTYVLETSMLGEYAPQAGDIYTIKGQFLSHDEGGTYTGKYILDISESSFVVSENSSRSYFTVLPQKCADGGEATMPAASDNQAWHFLFNLMDLTYEEAPSTGDTYGYYATSTEDVYVDGHPVVKMDKQLLRRRDTDPTYHLFYVCFQSGYQNWTINLGSIVVFDGTFVYKGNQTLPNNQQIGFSLNEVAFRKIGSKINDYEVINFRQYLFNTINNNYDVGNYSGEARTEVARIFADLENDIFEPETVKEVYQAYDDIVARLASYAIDPAAASDNLKKIKTDAIQEIKKYPNFDNYYPAEQEVINAYILDFVNKVETKTNKSDVASLVKETKAKIDAVKVKQQVVIDSVEKCLPGYEQYLFPYDRLSLNSLNLDSFVYHADKETRDKNDFNTNPQELNALNSFVPSKGNDKCNLVFQFKYEPYVAPGGKGTQLMFVLRGTPLRGYKVGIDTDTRGCFLQKVGQSTGVFVGGTSFIFANGGTYIVEIGAIDIIGYDLTWVFVRVDGEIRYSVVVESLNICTNPRVAICPDDGNTVDTPDGEVCLVSNYDDGVVSKSSEYVSAPKLSEENASNDKIIYCSSKENDLPYSTDLSYEFYPSSKEAITLTRGLVTENIAVTSEPILAKTSETSYQFNIKDIDLHDGDVLTINGRFAYFDSKTNQKVSFVFGKVVLTYNESVNGWSQSESLDDYKEDAKLQLEYFVDLDDYDGKIALAVSGVISKGKRLINECTSQSEVDAVVNETKAKILRFKTSLEVLKESTINEIKDYKKEQIKDYREDEQKEIETLKTEAITNVKDAENAEEVVEILATFKLNVDEIKTSSVLDQEELEEARRNGIKEIQNHYASLNVDKYSSKKREQLNQETEKAIQELKEAASIEEINLIVKGYISAHPINKINGGIIAIIVCSSVAAVAGIGLLVFFLVRRRRKTL